MLGLVAPANTAGSAHAGEPSLGRQVTRRDDEWTAAGHLYVVIGSRASRDGVVASGKQESLATATACSEPPPPTFSVPVDRAVIATVEKMTGDEVGIVDRDSHPYAERVGQHHHDV
jgi:hypothetical protein